MVQVLCFSRRSRMSCSRTVLAVSTLKALLQWPVIRLVSVPISWVPMAQLPLAKVYVEMMITPYGPELASINYNQLSESCETAMRQADQYGGIVQWIVLNCMLGQLFGRAKYSSNAKC